MAQDNSVLMEGVRIVFRNFSGKEGLYNREGERGFNVILPPDVAKTMAEDGWNIKMLKPREEDDEPTPTLAVSVSYKNRPPRVVMITSRGRTNLGEDEIGTLDWVDIVNVDLIVRPYEWIVNGKSGIKAYLQSIFITIDEDPLERKYAEIQEAKGPRESFGDQS